MAKNGVTAVDLVRVADLWEENQEHLKQQLGHSDSRRFGAHWVLMPESPFPRFNHAGCVRVEQGEVAGLITECRAFFREQGVPTCALLVSPATQPVDLGQRLQGLGFSCELNPVMIWQGKELPVASPRIRVERAGADKEALVFHLLQRVFFPGASEDNLEAGRRGVRVAYAIGAIHYIAYWENRPAGAGMLFPHGGMGGIYNMCTLPEFRGQGVATAVMAAIMEDAWRAGCEYVGLTPTIMGRPLYQRLGFREAYRERYYAQRV